MAADVTTKKKFNKYTFVSSKLGAKVLVNGKQKSADTDPSFAVLKTTIKGINNLGSAFNSLNSQLVDLSTSLSKTFKVFTKADKSAAKNNLESAKLSASEIRSERKKESDEKNKTRRSLDTSAEQQSEKRNPLGLERESKEKIEKPSLGLFDFLKNFIQLFVKFAITSSVLKWMMDPKNTEKLGKMFVALRDIVKFIWNVTEKLAGFITGAVVNLGSGVFKTVDGLKKGDIGQVFQGLGQVLIAIPGLLALKWLLNPASLIKDISGILGKESAGPSNNGGRGNQGRTGITGNTPGRTPTTSSAAARRYADRFGIDAARKRFGKDAVKSLGGKYARSGVTNVARKALVGTLGKGGTKAVLKFAKPFLKRLPIVGALIDFGLSVALGEPLGRAAFKSIGAFILGAIGTGFGGPLGAIIGGFAGDWVGGKLYDVFFAKKPDGKNKPPEFEKGGIASNGKKLTPQQVGGVLVDSTTQTLSGLGPGGKTAEQFLGGEISKLETTFGQSGVLVNQTKLRVATKKSSKDPSSVKDGGLSEFESLLGNDAKPSITTGQVSGDTTVVGLLASVVGVLASLVNKDFNKGESGSGGSGAAPSTTSQKSAGDIDTSGIEAASGSVVDKGVAIAKKLQSNLGITKEAAAGIAGNFAHESGGFIPGIREGGPFGKSSKPWPKGTVGRGYGWAQWTNSVPGDRYDKFIQSYGGDYNKIPTNEDNLKFAIEEMKTTNPLSSGFKKMTDTAAAAVWFRKNWERAGVHHDGPRISYAKGILAKMAIGGPLGADPGRQGRERHTAVVTQFSKAKTLKDTDLPGYAAGGSHRTIPNTPSTSWAAGIPLTYVNSSSGQRAEVAVPLAKRFQGFIRDLEGTGYKIKEMGGFRPDGPPGGNADGKGPMYAHPYGAAIDINWTRNPAFTKIPSKRYGDFPSNTKQIATKWGLGWGSAFDDAMHFSAMKREYGQGIDGKEISSKTLGASGAGADFKPGSDVASTSTSSSGGQQSSGSAEENWMDALKNAFSGKTANDLLFGSSSASAAATTSSSPGSAPQTNSGSYTPGSIPSSGSLNIQQLVSLSLKVGFKGRHAAIAASVAYAESTGNPMAHNKVPPDNSYGLWQINMIGNLGPARRKQWGLKSNEELFNPETNAKIAYKISGGVNFSAWTTYTGGKYKAHLQAAEKALASMQTKAAGGGIIDFKNLNFKVDSDNKLGLDIKNPFTTPTKSTPMQQWAKNFPNLARKVKPGQSGYDEIQSALNPSPTLNFAKGMDTSKLSYSSTSKQEKKEVKLTPMQQWAKNFPELAKKVKPGQSGYEEIQAYLFPNKYSDIAKKGFELASKGVSLVDMKSANTSASLNADKVIKESPRLPDESTYTKNKLLILNNFRKEVVASPAPQIVRSTPMPQACYSSFFNN